MAESVGGARGKTWGQSLRTAVNVSLVAGIGAGAGAALIAHVVGRLSEWIGGRAIVLFGGLHSAVTTIPVAVGLVAFCGALGISRILSTNANRRAERENADGGDASDGASSVRHVRELLGEDGAVT